jgi:hypothetical protein
MLVLREDSAPIKPPWSILSTWPKASHPTGRFDVLSCRLSLRAIASGTNLRSVGNETWGVFALRADRWLSSEKLVETPFLENQQVLAHKEA